MVSFLFSWLLLFSLCTIKINFLQDTLEPQKYKSKYFTGKKKKYKKTLLTYNKSERKVPYRPELTGKRVPPGNEIKFLKFKTEVN